MQVSIADTFINQNTNENRGDDDLTKREGSQKVFLRGSDTSCRQHARKHWAVYKRKCEDAEVPVHHWAVPRTIWNEMEGKKHDKDRQTTLDGKFPKRTGLQEFTHVGILHAVAQFIACDDHVSLRNVELRDLLSAEGLLVISCC